MRLWHKDLVPYLPRKQLIGQWRECCLIAKGIAENGTPNHLLVNRVMDYPLDHFYQYTKSVYNEVTKRGHNARWGRFSVYFEVDDDSSFVFDDELFSDWHNDRYLRQCYYNLQEKYDCGGITEEEWRRIDECFGSLRGVTKSVYSVQKTRSQSV